jgi:hypothetical protein
MKNPMKTITNLYNKLSNFGKILIFISLLLIVVVFFKYLQRLSPNNTNSMIKREGFQQQQEFLIIHPQQQQLVKTFTLRADKAPRVIIQDASPRPMVLIKIANDFGGDA